MLRPSGTVTTYAPIADPIGHGSSRFNMATVTDTSGNRVSYDFNFDVPTDGVPYLEAVTFGPYSLEVLTEQRPDPVVAADAGRLTVLRTRVSSITIRRYDTGPHGDAGELYGYKFLYATSPRDGRSILRRSRPSARPRLQWAHR